MQASNANSSIFLTDTPQQIEEKVIVPCDALFPYVPYVVLHSHPDQRECIQQRPRNHRRVPIDRWRLRSGRFVSISALLHERRWSTQADSSGTFLFSFSILSTSTRLFVSTLRRGRFRPLTWRRSWLNFSKRWWLDTKSDDKKWRSTSFSNSWHRDDSISVIDFLFCCCSYSDHLISFRK